LKITIAIYLSLASIKDVQAKGEAISPQKRTSSTLKDENITGNHFLVFWAIFALLDPDQQYRP
jgi:hypothetical protein